MRSDSVNQLDSPMRYFGNMHGGVEGKTEWLTPPQILSRLGPFDLDPCAPVNRPWDTAKHHFTIVDDGLAQAWYGRAWLNPPYGDETEAWVRKLSEHGDGIALIFARTETKIFFPHVWEKANAVLFIKGRLPFYHVSGSPARYNAGAPSCLVAYGKHNSDVLRSCGIAGAFIELR